MNLRSLITLGKKRFRERDFEKTRNILNRAVNEGGTYPDVYYTLGLTCRYLGDMRGAIDCFNKALERNPEYLEALLGLSITLNDMGHYGEGRKIFNKTIDSRKEKGEPILFDLVKPRVVNHLRELGKIYASINQTEEAIHYFKKAVEIAPEYPDIKSELASILKEAGGYEEAKQHLKEILEKNPYSVPALLNLGLICYLEGNEDKSRFYWEKAHEAEPTNKLTLTYLNSMNRG